MSLTPTLSPREREQRVDVLLRYWRCGFRRQVDVKRCPLPYVGGYVDERKFWQSVRAIAQLVE